MENLKGITDGEFENNADLLGLTDAEAGEDLLGRISRLPKQQQGRAVMQAVKSIKANPSQVGTSRHEFERRFLQLPKEIREGLINKRLQLTDTRYYVVKDISTKNSIDVFQGTDQKSVGLGSLANQKLEKDNWFILFAIRMLYAVSPAGMATADFTHIPPLIRNGEFELEAGNKKIVGLMDCSAFDTQSRNDIPLGFYKVENSKIIEPQVEIKMPVKFTAAAPATSFLRVTFIGTSVVPY